MNTRTIHGARLAMGAALAALMGAAVPALAADPPKEEVPFWAIGRPKNDVAAKMTYLELSADNTFMDEYTSALFLPHTDLTGFPSVHAALAERGRGNGNGG